MRQMRGRVIEVDSLEEFDLRLARGAASLSGWRLRGLDLQERADVLSRVRVEGALFLGCTFATGVPQRLGERGAIVFPALPGTPVDTYRTALYTPQELFDTPHYPDSLDARAYAWSCAGIDADLARSLHDHAIDQAL